MSTTGRHFGGYEYVSGLSLIIWSLCFVLSAITSSPAKAAGPADLFRDSAAQSTVTVDHSTWDRLLKSYVIPGPDRLNRVDYAAFKDTGHGDLKLYIRKVQEVDPRTLNRSEQFALLANLYNAKTIDIVLDHYPVRSIKDISLGGGLFAAVTGGPWKAKVVKLNGVDLTLDDIEHGILRPVFRDPRVHYAVNCASIGCPNLRTEAFTGTALDAQLDAAARDYVNHPRGITVRSGSLIASSIYSWFKVDFGGSDAGVIAHARKYANPDLSAKLEGITTIDSHAYDWALNDAKR